MIFKKLEPYVNKTWVFLRPCLTAYGEEFQNQFKYVSQYGLGVYDEFLKNTPYSSDKNLYILCDPTVNSDYFESFLFWVKKQEYHQGDYHTSVKCGKERRMAHMIILSIPEIHHMDYDFFLEGKYSKMYNKEFRLENFKKKGRLIALSVLEKEKGKKELFRVLLNKEFNTTLNNEKDMASFDEYELPLKRYEEIFHCSGDRIFFDKKLDII